VASAGLFSGAETVVGTGVLMDAGSKDKRQLTAPFRASGCAPGSRVDSVRIRGLGTG
jgi:hypothetical protein